MPSRQVIDDERLAVLKAEHDELGSRLSTGRQVLRVVTVAGMLLILTVLIGLYLYHNERRIIASPGRLFVYLTICVSTVVLGRLLSMDPWRAELVPVTVTVMLLAIVYGHELAILTAVALALILTPSTIGTVGELVLLIGVSVTAVAPLRRIASRSRLVKVGFQTAAACFVISAGFDFLAGEPVTGPWLDQNVFMRSARAAGWCLVAGYLVAGSLPFIEQAFGVVTNISLLEMSDISHPLLRELVRLAPGTYNHSIAVATIGETAAERIGANGLSGARRRLLPRRRQNAQAALFHRKRDRGERKPPPASRPGDEHADHHRPRQGRRRPGHAVQPAQAADRFHRAASRHDAGRILLSRGDPPGRSAARLQGRASRNRPSAIPAPSRKPARRACSCWPTPSKARAAP